MSEDNNAAVLAYVEAGGTKFGKLTVRDRARILSKLKAEKRAVVVRNLAESGITDSSMRYTELERFDAGIWGTPEFIDYINTPDGQIDVLTVAAGKYAETDKAADEVVDKLAISAGETMRLVASLCGLEVVRPEESSADPNVKPGEPAPLTGYGS